jgi:hypothetical protein
MGIDWIFRLRISATEWCLLNGAFAPGPYSKGLESENTAKIYPRSNAAARKALELDATLAHPHYLDSASRVKTKS